MFQKNLSRLAVWIGIAAASFLSACSDNERGSGSSTEAVHLAPIEGGGPAAQQRFFDQKLTAFDGETIAMTVYIPELEDGEAVPLILHSHGFGLSRASNLQNPDPLQGFLTNDPTAEAARRSWLDRGYYVISFDQRGFGESSGTVTVLDPDIDGRNISTILDWAEENLPNLAYRHRDPVIGSVGLSYGGGYQTIGAAVDERFDALVPTATWHDLQYSLYANDTPKNIWIDILVAAGAPTSGFMLESFIYTAFLESTTTGTVNQETVERLSNNGPESFCANTRADGRGPARADAFFVQGVQDVLFNMNEAVDNFDCYAESGNDARLLVQSNGHIILLLQESGAQFLFGVDEFVQCGDQRFETAEMMVSYLDERLLGIAANPPIPRICISVDENLGITPNSIPRGGVSLDIPVTSVTPGGLSSVLNLLQSLPLQTVLTLLADLPGDVLTTLTDVLSGVVTDPAAIAEQLPAIVNLLPPEVLQNVVAAGQFIPLQTITSEVALAGIPRAQLNITGGNGADNLLFIGLGVKPADGGDARLVDQQVLPVRGSGALQLDLIGVAERINAKDTLGIFVYGFHPYFLNVATLTQAPLPAQVSGSVALPLLTLP